MRNMRFLVGLLFAGTLVTSNGFVTMQPTLAVPRMLRLHLSTIPARSSDDFTLSMDEINPLMRFGKGEKEKVVNAFGVRCLLVSLLTGPVWMAAMMIVGKISEMKPEWDPNHSIYDATGKVWSKTWLALTGGLPEVSGNVDNVKKNGGPCLYVANHASWLDIPILCTVLDPVFKFIAKGELAKVPCIGQQLKGGEHIMIDREDRRSQLRTFKEGISWLKKGVPIMAFPEGMRSKDGRLMPFKGGLFSMAVKCGVPIVPITLSHTHAVMPSSSFFPVQSGVGKLRLHVHEKIESTGKSEEELGELVRQAFLSELPAGQHPLELDEVYPEQGEVAKATSM